MFIVTGASSGIGRSTALALAGRGERVLAVARSTDALAALQRRGGSNISMLSADLSVAADLDALVEATADDVIDGIVHSAGSLIAPQGYAELDAAELAAHFAVHVAAPSAINNRLADRLVGARIVYIDSYSATDLRVGWSAYSIIKAAAQMAARAARAELSGALIIRIFPGGVRTPLVDRVLGAATPSPARDAFTALDAAGNLADPDDVGAYIAEVLLDVSDGDIARTDTWSFPASTPP